MSDGKSIFGEATDFGGASPPQWSPATVRNPTAGRASFTCPRTARAADDGYLLIISEHGMGWWVFPENLTFGPGQPYVLHVRYNGQIENNPEEMAGARTLVAEYLSSNTTKGSVPPSVPAAPPNRNAETSVEENSTSQSEEEPPTEPLS